MPWRSMSPWSSSRPTRSPSKSRRRRPAHSATSLPRTARPPPSVRCSDRSMTARRQQPANQLLRRPGPRRHRQLPPRPPPHRPPRLKEFRRLMRRWRRRCASSPPKAGSMPPPSPARARMAASPRATCSPRSKRQRRRRRRSISPPPRCRCARLRPPTMPRVKMTRLRQTIARRLKDVQNTAAMLTTFNEVDMSHIMAMRAQYKDVFEKKHGSKLGFMGFFTKACVQALKDIPAANAEIDGTDLIYKNYYHIGVAVGTDKGLAVPVVRDCDQKSIAEIEKAIADFGRRARDGQLKIDEMQGGTFTITNGGIYGSLMSTPILNAPQSAILGMHKIQDRPVAIAGKVEIRPMMYLALSYDHRVIDGKEAVTFLVRVKESLEDPARLVLDL